MSRSNGLTRLRYLLLVIASLAISGLPACAGDVDLAAEEYIEKAKEFHEKGEPRAAIIELKNALLKKPESTEARWLLGQIYLEQAAVESAEKEFRRAVEFGLSQEAAEIPLTRALCTRGNTSRSSTVALIPSVSRSRTGQNCWRSGPMPILA